MGVIETPYYLANYLESARDRGVLPDVMEPLIQAYSEQEQITRPEVYERLGRAAGIQGPTVAEIMRGRIATPPTVRLEGFAQVLESVAGPILGQHAYDLSPPGNFDEVWRDLTMQIGSGRRVRTLPGNAVNEFGALDDAIQTTTDKGIASIPRADIQEAWTALQLRGILPATDFPGRAQYRSTAISTLLTLLPYVDYTVHPTATLFLTDHTFSNGELSTTFGIGTSQGIRYAGPAYSPTLVVFITSANEDASAGESNHPYRDRWEGNLLHYTGEGLVGDQQMSRGNQALRTSIQHDFPVYGFNKVTANRYNYLGRFRTAKITQETQTDTQGNERNAFVFQMQRVALHYAVPFGQSARYSVPARRELDEVCSSFGRQLRNSHIVFGQHHDEVVRAFLASLATKPFVILTGLSGSGKTQIALRFGEWLGEGRSMLVPVRPDWTGSEALFGYEDALTDPDEQGHRSWHVPDPLQFMLRAAEDPEHPYLLILDEMNLAHVERYFADVLSGMESGTPVLPNLAEGADPEHPGEWRLKPDGGPETRKIPVPSNLFVVGTVNVDETTYMFSPKVLDRANTFEFRVKTEDLTEEARKPKPLQAGDPALVRGFLKIARDETWHIGEAADQGADTAAGRAANRAPVSEDDRAQFVAHLRRLHKLLSKHGWEFGHRTFYEAIRFMAMLISAGQQPEIDEESGVEISPVEISPVEIALDLQVMQKVLPRLHGSLRRLDPVLRELGQFCFDQNYIPPDPIETGAGRFDPLNPPAEPGRPWLRRSFDKIQRMSRNLRANQFASFTE